MCFSGEGDTPAEYLGRSPSCRRKSAHAMPNPKPKGRTAAVAEAGSVEQVREHRVVAHADVENRTVTLLQLRPALPAVL